MLHKLPLSHAIFRTVADHQARDLHLKASITSISFYPQYYPFHGEPKSPSRTECPAPLTSNEKQSSLVDWNESPLWNVIHMCMQPLGEVEQIERRHCLTEGYNDDDI